MIDSSVIQRAKIITRQYGRGFYRASFLFPKHIREATWILYAVVRIPDEMVDSQSDKLKAASELSQWQEQWSSVIESKHNQNMDTLLVGAKEVFDTYKIPYHYMESFFTSMKQDITKTRYATYQDLETYMYGSASVIGIMMSYIIGFKEGALPYAKSLGEAFQLINFLRDLNDDYSTRGRIYIPIEDMERFGITEEYFVKRILDDKWRNFMKFEVSRAKKLLEEGHKGIPLLFGRGQKAVYASYLIYGKIIEEIEKAQYDTFSKRIVVSPLDKTMLLCKALWKKSQ